MTPDALADALYERQTLTNVPGTAIVLRAELRTLARAAAKAALEDAAEAYKEAGGVTGEHTAGFFYVGDWEGEPDEWLMKRAGEVGE